MPPTESRLSTSAMAVAFALVSALLAAFMMGALETRLLDEASYALGVGIAAVVGFVAAHVGKRRGALAVVGAGALVGMIIQAVLLVRLGHDRTYQMTPWVTTKDPLSWILVGAPLGALPAVAAAALFFFGMQLSRTHGRPPAKDAPERVLVPIAGTAAVLAGVAIFRARQGELLVVLFVLAISCAALLEVARIDRARIRWIRDVFEQRDPAFTVVDLAESRAPDVPLVVAGLEPMTVLTHVSQSGLYRSSAGVRYGVAGMTSEATVKPLIRRIRLAVALAASASICAMFAALAR